MSNHSFAVMAYKDSPYLPDCLDSLKNQTVTSDIYISTSTPSPYITEIAKKYNVKIFITQSRLGIAHDWNFSLEQAKTKYVTLAHQDDLYDPHYTQRCIKGADKFTDTLICFTDYTEIAGEKERRNTLLLNTKRLMLRSFMPFKKNISSKFWKRIFQSFGTPISCPSVMYNKEMLSNFQFSESYSVSLDWDAWLRMTKMKGRFVYIPADLLKHRIHTGSATTEAIKGNKRQREDLEIYCRIWPPLIARLFSKLYSKSYKSNDL